jgi:hypothetical protein
MVQVYTTDSLTDKRLHDHTERHAVPSSKALHGLSLLTRHDALHQVVCCLRAQILGEAALRALERRQAERII